MQITRKLLTVLGLICLVGFTALVGATLWDQRSAGGAEPRLSGGSPAIEALLGSTLARIPSQSLDEIAVGVPPPGMAEPNAEALARDKENEGSGDSVPSGPDTDHIWLYIKARGGVTLTEAAWEANLLAVSYQTQAQVAGTLPISGYTLGLRRVPSGGDYEAGDLLQRIKPADQMSPRSALQESIIRSRFESGARKAGFELNNVSYWSTPQQLAVRVTITTDAPESVVNEGAGRKLYSLLGDETGYDARELRVLDRAGNPVMITAVNFDLGVGERWISPNLR